MKVWYSQQVEEGKAPGYPLGYGPYGETYDVRLVKVVGNEEEEDGIGDEEEEVTVERDRRGVPLYGRMQE